MELTIKTQNEDSWCNRRVLGFTTTLKKVKKNLRNTRKERKVC